MKRFSIFWLCAFVTIGCVGTTLETPKNHPADPNAPVPARARASSVLSAEPEAKPSSEKPTPDPHAHMHHGGMQ